MKRIAIILVAVLALGGLTVYGAGKLAIRHDVMVLHDDLRHRDIGVDVYVRRDVDWRATVGLSKPMRVAVLNHGYTVKHSEYSFIAKILAARGYLVASIQHDVETDAPLSYVGYPYVGRQPMYERGVANINFMLSELKKVEPNADYEKLTMVGHSNGGDISMFFAMHEPERVARVVTLDNLRVPFLKDKKLKILSFRSRDWKPDPGVVPTDEECEAAGIKLVHTDAQHTEMSDRGPDTVKERIQSIIDKFLSDDDDQPAAAPAAEQKPAELSALTP